MKKIDYTPDYYVEKKWLNSILDNLVKENITVVIRDKEEHELPNEKYITIITSTEQHNYYPTKELEDSNCKGVFMHYAPINGDSYQIDNFYKHPKLHSIPLGYHKDFPLKNIGDLKIAPEREIDVCFWGQYDPYRRTDFLRACERIKDRYNTSLRFYTGWNKGWSPESYAECLENSVIALVPWGSASRNSFRFWEAYYSGCIIICNTQYKTWYDWNNYYPVKDDWSDLEENIDLILRNKIFIDLHNSIEVIINDKIVAKYIKEQIK